MQRDRFLLTNQPLPFVFPPGVAETRDDGRDRELLSDLAAGRPQALAELYDRQVHSLFRHAVALCRDRSEAEDLVQAVFLKLAVIGAPLLGVRSPASYLHRMLRTHWLDGRRRAITGERIVEGSVPGGLVGPESTPESIDLLRALDDLPDEQREVVVLHVVDGFSFREVGGMTGVSTFTAAGRYRLALIRLRRQLDPGGARAHFGRRNDRQGT